MTNRKEHQHMALLDNTDDIDNTLRFFGVHNVHNLIVFENQAKT